MLIEDDQSNDDVGFLNPVPVELEELISQCDENLEEQIKWAVYAIDRQFHPGYAEEYPELISGSIQVTATEYQALRITQTLQEATVMIARTISAENTKLCGAIDRLSSKLHEVLGFALSAQRVSRTNTTNSLPNGKQRCNRQGVPVPAKGTQQKAVANG